jgi:23S rRNA (pseudouridine1915-N3)-methyltransferase
VTIQVVFLGEDPRDPLQIAAQQFIERCGRRYGAKLVPLAPARRGKGADDERVRALEAEALLEKSAGHTRIALDAAGKLHGSSLEFAKALEKRLAAGKPLSFLIGGATGLHPRVRAESDDLWSLSPLTLAHRLAVCVLAEQLYRAAEIARGGPYAK